MIPMPRHSWWQRQLLRFAHWLLRRQAAATELQDARIHPDGGPGPYEGDYPWEADGEALATLPEGYRPSSDLVIGVDVAVEHPSVVVADRHGKMTLLTGTAVGMVPQIIDPERDPVDPIALEPVQLLPDEPGYWDQFAEDRR